MLASTYTMHYRLKYIFSIVKIAKEPPHALNNLPQNDFRLSENLCLKYGVFCVFSTFPIVLSHSWTELEVITRFPRGYHGLEQKKSYGQRKWECRDQWAIWPCTWKPMNHFRRSMGLGRGMEGEMSKIRGQSHFPSRALQVTTRM